MKLELKNSSRLKFLRITICAGLLLGIVFSHELWFPVRRTFPRAPMIFALPENFVAPLEWLLSGVLVAALIFIAASFRPKIFLIAAIASLVLLICLDQTRLQPWVYQYLLLLAVLALRDRETKDETASTEMLGLLQTMIAGLYVWSGVQKLNFTFSHETLPMLLAPVQNIFPSSQPPFVLLGISIALAESLIGCGLLFRRTRNSSVWLAVGVHAIILTLLVAKDFNSIVWVWNAALIPLIITSFWRNDDSVFRAFAAGESSKWKWKTAKLVAAASVLLPVLSFFGWWDAYLSGALYSGNTAVAVVRIEQDVFEKLPEKARQSVFRTKTGGELILPLFEWAMADLNVPAYPERRVFTRAAREVCRTAQDKNRAELIIKERPAIFDGSYKLTRISCTQLN